MLQAIEEGSFWGAAVLLVYTYLGYPLLAALLAGLRARPVRAAPWEPSVTLVVVAQDEATRIGRRIRNLLALDYPPERLAIIVASDGSGDETVERALAVQDERLRVVAFAERRGKSAVLNDVLAEVDSEVVVLADARQRFEAGALRALVAPLADPAVGAVSGELLLQADGGGAPVGEGIGFYWRYEKAIRSWESSVDSTVGVTGAIYALKRGLVRPIPPDTILDDVWLPMSVVRRGYRVVFQPAARAFDQVSATAGQELARKVRTIAGTFQLLWRERWLMNPFANRIWLQTVSHKALRLTGPVLLAVTLVTSLALAAEPRYAVAFAAQVAFYGAAFMGRAVRRDARTIRLLVVPYVFCLLNWATVLALARLLSGRQRVTWKEPPAEHTPGCVNPKEL